jgi:hypothetical protein
MDFLYINGNVFFQARIGGSLVPTTKTILETLKRFSNKSTASHFCQISNKITFSLDKQYNPQNYLGENILEQERINHHREVLEIEIRRFNIAKLDYFHPFFIHAEATMSWYLATVCNFGGGDMQGISRAIPPVLKRNLTLLKGVVAFKEYITGAKETNISKRDYSTIFLGYPTALLAYLPVVATNNIIATLSFGNNELLKLENKRLELIKKEAQRLEKLEKGMVNFYCRFCDEYHVVPQGKTPKSCGSKKCEDDWKKAWEEKNRPPAPKLDTTSWVVAFDGKRRSCQGILCSAEGGCLRKVDINYVCFECHKKTTPE